MNSEYYKITFSEESYSVQILESKWEDPTPKPRSFPPIIFLLDRIKDIMMWHLQGKEDLPAIADKVERQYKDHWCFIGKGVQCLIAYIFTLFRSETNYGKISRLTREIRQLSAVSKGQKAKVPSRQE